MDVNIVNLQKLFAQPVRYVIPLFQRPYVWNQDNQWEPLWEDVQNTAEHYLQRLKGQSNATNTPAHFLGAVVMQQQPVPVPMLMTRLVVDGQQRLTTTQLLLDAVQETFEERGHVSAAKRLQLLVLNQEEFRDDHPDHAFKVWPTLADQESFRTTMHNHLTSEDYESSLIVEAHKFFKLQVGQWLDAQEQEQEQAAAALEFAVTQLLELVVIDLSISDDPHVIFETLNARGTPLLESDLMKNMILYEAGQHGLTNGEPSGSGFWDFADVWWRQDVQQGRLVRPRIDVFLNYWLVLRTRDEVKANDVFSTFRNYYRNGSQTIAEAASDIRSISKHYETLERALDPAIETFLYRKDVMQAGVLTPVLLWLMSNPVPQAQLKKGLLAMESHQLRRMVCRISTMGNNRLFISLLEFLEKAGPDTAGDTIVDYLAGQTSTVGHWPTDEELERAFSNLALFRLLTRGRLRMVLEGIEEGLRTDKSESSKPPRNLTIEHVLPQGWREHWPLPSEISNEDETKRTASRRDTVLHSIGNLTLVNFRLNASLSNAKWSNKRGTLKEHSVLFLNKMLEDAPDVWDEVAIENRSIELCGVAKKVWPHTDKLR